MVTVTTSQDCSRCDRGGPDARRSPELATRIEDYFEYCKRNDLRVQAITTRGVIGSAGTGCEIHRTIHTHRGRCPDGIVIRRQAAHLLSGGLPRVVVMPTKNMKPGEEDYAVACARERTGVRIVNTNYAPRTGRGLPGQLKATTCRRDSSLRRRVRAQ